MGPGKYGAPSCRDLFQSWYIKGSSSLNHKLQDDESNVLQIKAVVCGGRVGGRGESGEMF